MTPSLHPIFWNGSALRILDQRKLPHQKRFITATSSIQVAEAIRKMVLRGAPLIGCAAAYGYALGLKGWIKKREENSIKTTKPGMKMEHHLSKAAQTLKASRPTAVALAYAVDRMSERTRDFIARNPSAPPAALLETLIHEADSILREDIKADEKMAEHGVALLPSRSTVITYCNTGALATTGIGTALGVIRRAFACSKIEKVYVCETRPYLQGSRLTLWELLEEKIPAILITDNMAAHLMRTEKIDAVLVGADRIAANGDVANKIGTYSLALQSRHHHIPFYVVAPSNTIDFSLASGDQIPIEERSPEEVTRIASRWIAPRRATARHPAFDITPHDLVTALVTEKGVLQPLNPGRLGRISP